MLLVRHALAERSMGDMIGRYDRFCHFSTLCFFYHRLAQKQKQRMRVDRRDRGIYNSAFFYSKPVSI